MEKGTQTLEELLGDPTIQLVMARDGWEADDIRLLLDEAGRRAAVRMPPPYVIGPHVIGPRAAAPCSAWLSCR